MEIIRQAQAQMRALGSLQWQDGYRQRPISDTTSLAATDGSSRNRRRGKAPKRGEATAQRLRVCRGGTDTVLAQGSGAGDHCSDADGSISKRFEENTKRDGETQEALEMATVARRYKNGICRQFETRRCAEDAGALQPLSPVMPAFAGAVGISTQGERLRRPGIMVTKLAGPTAAKSAVSGDGNEVARRSYGGTAARA